mgnify:CR=1 FL=1
MHSPRRSARRVMRLRPNRSSSQAGRSPPIMSPSRLASAQRASRPRPTAFSGAQAGAHHGLLEVQQAEIVLAALADHHAAALLGRIAVQAVELVVDLALQVAGVGGDPHRRAVLLRPQRGGRDIAQGLADAGAGLDQHDVGLVLLLARREGLAGGRGVVALGRRAPRPCWGRRRSSGPAAGAPRAARPAALPGGGVRRRLLPLRQALPDVEAGARPRLPARPDRCRGAASTASPHGHWPRAMAECGVLELGRGERCHVLQLVEQRARPRAGRRLLPRASSARVRSSASQKPARRRQAELRRPHEGEEFQKVARRQIVQPEPRRHRRRMADQRQAAGRAQRRVGRGQPLDRAVGRAPQGAARGRDQGRPGRKGEGTKRWIA